MDATLNTALSVDNRVLKRIRGRGRGAVFVPGDFLDLGSRQAIDLVLHRLTKRGLIRRVARGLYDYPKTHPQLGVLAPTTDAIVKALAGKDKLRLQPTGAYAANLLRLSEQVPAKIVFLTDGPTRKIAIGRREIVLQQTTPKNMAAGRTSGLVIQALRYLGRTHVTENHIATLREVLADADRARLRTDLALAPAWMHPHLRAIAEGASA